MFELTADSNGAIRLSGRLEVECVHRLETRLREACRHIDPETVSWDLSNVETIDSAAAMVLWEAWGGKRPESLEMADRHGSIFEQLADIDPDVLDHPHRHRKGRTLDQSVGPVSTAAGVLTVFGRFVLDLLLVIRRPTQLPLRELSAACYRAGATALPIVSIVGVLIGIVLSYLSSLQLREYGAESFLPLILGVGVVRELGPLLAAIVIAGRSGSAITAGLAAMRLTQELDALSALGVSHSLRLVLPRTLALAITLPLLVICTNVASLAGGMVSGWIELDMNPWAFLKGLREDVDLAHYVIGLFKSFVFGLTVGLIACYFGLRARPNTQSLASETTRSVVISISAIILLDAMFAVLFKGVP